MEGEGREVSESAGGLARRRGSAPANQSILKTESEGVSNVERSCNVGRWGRDHERLLLVDPIPVDLALGVAGHGSRLGIKVGELGGVLGGEGGDEVGGGLPPGVPRLLDVGRVVARGHGVREICFERNMLLLARLRFESYSRAASSTARLGNAPLNCPAGTSMKGGSSTTAATFFSFFLPSPALGGGTRP